MAGGGDVTVAQRSVSASFSTGRDGVTLRTGDLGPLDQALLSGYFDVMHGGIRDVRASLGNFRLRYVAKVAQVAAR